MKVTKNTTNKRKNEKAYAYLRSLCAVCQVGERPAEDFLAVVYS